jgi:zinc and cadmium transporter
VRPRQCHPVAGIVSPILNTALAVVGVSALSLIGLLSLSVGEARLEGWAPLLASLASGALVGAAAFELIPEAVTRGHLSGAWVAVGVVAGFVLFGILERLLMTGLGRRVAGGAGRAHPPIVTLNFLGDVIHNAADGVMIAAAFLSGRTVGVVTTLAIILHEIPRELGSFGVFIHGGLSIRRAAWYNGLTGLAAVAGATATLLVGIRTASVATTLLPIAAGTFLYIGLSIAPTAMLGAPSMADRVRRIALGAIGLAATALAAQIG